MLRKTLFITRMIHSYQRWLLLLLIRSVLLLFMRNSRQQRFLGKRQHQPPRNFRSQFSSFSLEFLVIIHTCQTACFSGRCPLGIRQGGLLFSRFLSGWKNFSEFCFIIPENRPPYDVTGMICDVKKRREFACRSSASPLPLPLHWPPPSHHHLHLHRRCRCATTQFFPKGRFQCQ